VKFFISEVIDRVRESQAMLVLRDRGGIFLDATHGITREAIEQSLKAADLPGGGCRSATWCCRFTSPFGLAQGSGFDFFGSRVFLMVKT